jgi:Ca2+-binding RTX toxin-like protein
VTVQNAEAANDSLVVNALAGDDSINASALAAGSIGLTLNGGAGADIVIGSQGDDLVTGGTGNDAALLGAGDDTFVWNPGDGSDVVEGQAGLDTLQFNGANISEKIDLSANGSRLRFSRDIASIVMDVNDTERVNFRALGGADLITVNDLSGTDVTEVNLDLGGTIDGVGGDGSADSVVVNATDGADVASVSGASGAASVLGLFSTVNIQNAEPALDTLTVRLLAGDDVLEASSLQSSAISLVGDGGTGDDVLLGGDGNDVLLGGDGDDVLIGNGGQDALDGGPGDNIIIQ